MGLTLLAHSHMPLKYRVESFQTAVHIINLLLASLIKFTNPFQLLFGKSPNYLLLQPFGCACFPFLRPYNKHKFAFHTTKCVFLGYNHSQAGYKCLHPSGKIYVSRHVQFNPNDFPYPSLFVSPSISSSSSSPIESGLSISHFQSLPSFSKSSKVAPSLTPSLSITASNQQAPVASHAISSSCEPPSAQSFLLLLLNSHLPFPNLNHLQLLPYILCSPDLKHKDLLLPLLMP